MAEHQDTGKPDGTLKATDMPQHRVVLGWPVMAVLVLLCLVMVASNALVWLKFVELRSQRNKEHLFWILCQPGYTSDQRSQAFSELLWQGNREWRSARLARIDLTGIQLAGADVQQAHLEGCKLSDADCTDAVFRQTQFDQADISGSDLTGVDLFEADLLKTDLRGTVLVDADLRGADIGQSNASGAKFVSADMTSAKLELAVLVKADLRLARLVGADLSFADLNSANLYRTDFSDATFHQTNLSDSNWWRAIGLSPDLMASFKERYPPSENAGKTLVQDFEQWRAEQEAAQTTNSQSGSTANDGS